MGEHSGSVVECLTPDRGAAGSSLTALRINSSLVLVQPRKTLPFLIERLLMGRNESNQTNKQNNDGLVLFISASFQGPGSSASPSSVSSLLNTPVREPPTQVCSLPNTSAATATDSGGNMWLSAALKNGSPENIVSCYTLIDMGLESRLFESKIEIIFSIDKFINMFCMHKSPSQGDSSFEYPHCVIWFRNKKKSLNRTLTHLTH